MIDSFLIVKDGKLVFERYFRGFNQYTLHTLQSVTKTVASTLVGIAVLEGAVKDVEQSIADHFPVYRRHFETDERKRGITVENLLTMTSGISWPEHSAPYAGKNIVWLLSAAYDWPGFVLQQPMAAAPGETFNYSTGVSTLLGALLHNAAGMPTDEFAEHYLFDPLGVHLHAWWRNTRHPDRWVHTGGGLHLMPRDLAKIGFLYINEGEWQGTRIISPEWIDASTRAHVKTGRTPTESYGYQWWLRPLEPRGGPDTAPNEILHAAGWGGQHMFVIPSYDIVVVFTGSNFTDKELERRPLTLLYERILPAVEVLAGYAPPPDY